MYKLEFEVRDNELDAQSIVNNANYMIYMAHARHKFLHEIGINFAEMTEKKQYLLLLKTTLEYKKSLRANDIFYVTCKLIPEGKIRFAFEQEIRLKNTDELIAKALNIGVCIDGNNRNRPYVPEPIRKLFS
ncbi:MAG: 4-hydroxybenzoyl-CoA thioesterase [Gammaproteobacteria bacterium]|jgi:acyl-CoA thioester hydrolase|nr:4-hydroxybenzoyl-CoA thioesterase [Gammaproteobacteria bacterium]